MKRVLGRSKRILFSILFFLGVVTSLALAQLPTATILGTVRDATGAVIPGATVTARHTETGLTRTAPSGPDGSYRFAALPVGIYEVRAEQMGFRAGVHSGMTVTVGQEAVVNFALQVGAIEQTVEVTGEAPLVNTTSGTLGTLVDERQVADLPLNGRNYTDLTLLQPGVVQHRSSNQSLSGAGTWFSANGAPPRSNNYLLDGASMGSAKDQSAASASSSTLGVEGIREWRVVTNSFSAEYGMRMGGQMTLVSKGGTNNLHGSVFEYLRNSALDARNFFDYPTDRRLPAFTRNQYGASLGGPIKRDKVFAFGTFEALKDRKGKTNYIKVIPADCHVLTNNTCMEATPANPNRNVAAVIAPLLPLFPIPNLSGNQYTFRSTLTNDDTYGQARVDYVISNNDSLFVRYTGEGAERFEPLDYPQFARTGVSRAQFVTASESHTFSPSMVGTFRVSYSQPTFNILSTPGVTGPQYAFVAGKPVGNLSIGGVQAGFGPDNRTPNNNQVQLYTWSWDLYSTKGRHSLKFGMLANHDRILLDNANFERGTISFADINSFLLGNATTYQALPLDAIGKRDLSYQTWGFYLQDDLRVRNNLTLNLGFRYEFHTHVFEAKGVSSALRDVLRDTAWTVGPFFENPSLKNFSPRFGFAWDVKGDGRTSVRGGAGLVYDIADFGGYLSFVGNRLPPFNATNQVNRPSPVTSLPLAFPPVERSGSAGLNGNTFDYHLRNPHMMQYNFTVERQLPFGMGLSLAYAGSRGFNLLGDKQGNPAVPSRVLPGGRFFWDGPPNEPPQVNPNLGSLNYESASLNSWYNSLQFVVRKQVSKGLQFQSAYTWGKLIDEKLGVTATESGGSSSAATILLPREVDQGPADWNASHSWRFNAIYRLPQMPVQGFGGKILNGWWMSGILTTQTGLQFTPTTSGDRSRSRGGSNRPDLVPGIKAADITQGVSRGCLVRNPTTDRLEGIPAGTPVGTPQRWFDPCAFALPLPGFLGNLGRNTLTAPGEFNLDFSLVKDTALGSLGESGKLEFRAEFFNILNRANFSRPSLNVFSGANTPNNRGVALDTAGQITVTDTDSRQIQFALKVIW